jgi:hypothetical protein
MNNGQLLMENWKNALFFTFHARCHNVKAEKDNEAEGK